MSAVEDGVEGGIESHLLRTGVFAVPRPAPPPGADPLSACTLLLVDDEEANLDLLEAVLLMDGFTSIVRTTDAREAVPLFEASRPDIVLLDLHMPHRSGFDVLADIRARTAGGADYLPVLVLTADATFRAKQQALSGGASDFLTKPFNNAEVVLRVRNLLQTRTLYVEQRRARRAAELLGAASRVLHASLDGATAATQLAALLAGELADLCAVDLVDEEGGGRLVRAALAESPAARAARGSAPAGAAYDGTRGPTGGTALAPDAPPFGEPAPAAVHVAPLVTGGVTVGRLALARVTPGATFDTADERLTAELARRAAHAVMNARLFRAARAATEVRDQVLAIVAHDLRNPLTAIRMDAELLREKLDPAALRPPETRALARIHDTARRMDALIQDLLDVSRVGGGALALRRAPHRVGDLLGEAAETLRPLAAAHDVRFEVAAADDAAVAWVDGDRVLQVISNLVGNAVKFTAPGGRVTLAHAAVGGELRVSVADTGSGIAPEELPHIFGAFWQARHADRRGLGLGLAIARGIVEAHGGSIWVESALGRGTTFVFSLPLGAAPTTDQPPPT